MKAAPHPWWYGSVEDVKPLRGTAVWRAYFHDRASCTFGVHVDKTAAQALEHAKQYGDAFAVEAVT